LLVSVDVLCCNLNYVHLLVSVDGYNQNARSE
jgi:hypothetical protein